MRGRFIVFEGIDTEILSEQAENLAHLFKKNEGLNVVITREPTDGPLGAQLKLLVNKRVTMHEYARALLVVADRMDHYFGTDKADNGSIYTDLQNGKSVLCVRYLLSSFAHQSEVVSFDWLTRINEFFPWPDLVIFVDVPVDSVLTKMIKEHGYDDNAVKAKREELIALRASYLAAIEFLHKHENCQIEVIESDSVEVIHRHCIKLVEKNISTD